MGQRCERANSASDDFEWAPKAAINYRRSVEAGHHMLTAGWYDKAEKELCSIEVVYARAKCGKLMMTSSYLNI